MKVSELSDALLDLWVAQAEGYRFVTTNMEALRIEIDGEWYSPSTNWLQAGPLIEKHGISVHLIGNGPDWMAFIGNDFPWYPAPTPLIAAMRALVHLKYGFDIPDGIDRG